MRYLLNVTLENRRCEDPEGAEFDTLAGAKAEAERVAREIAADRLLDGKTIASNDTVEVVDAFGVVRVTVTFPSVILAWPERESAPLLLGGRAVGFDRHHAEPRFTEQFLKSSSRFAESREIAANVRSTFEEIRARLASAGLIGSSNPAAR